MKHDIELTPPDSTSGNIGSEMNKYIMEVRNMKDLIRPSIMRVVVGSPSEGGRSSSCWKKLQL